MWRLFLLFLLWVAAPLQAQDTATLIADRISVAADQKLIAEGHVEVIFGAARLTASRISFDRETDRLLIDGPLTLVDQNGTTLLADQAEMAADLRNGILQSARLVLDQQLQLAATQINRVDGRYTQLSRTVASSCQVCAANPVPIWEIRAARVVHDQVEQQLYFDRAQFRIAGLPVFFLPRLRIPDPTLERATGFLLPNIRSTSTLGPGLRLPYFIVLGDSRDLTLTPYLATEATQTLGVRYRQALPRGTLQFDGALTSDTLVQGKARGYLFGSGAINTGDGYTLGFELQSVSDPAYLLDYGISGTDRLRSSIDLTRTRRTGYFNAQLLQFTSLRAGEVNATLPSLVGEVTLHRRFRPAILGGEGGLRFQSYSLLRTSRVDVIGRDTARASARLDWRRNWILPGGITASALASLTGDFYSIGQDSNFPATIVRTTPVGAIELRWPWVRTTPRGVSHVIEPVVQVIYSPSSGISVPNEDSVLVEFDEGNLFSLNRFPGADVTERGLRANLGLGWTRYDPAGWSGGMTVGRVFRADDLGQFSTASGLNRRTSDWLVAAQLRTLAGVSVTERAVFDDELSFAKNEVRLAMTTDKLALATSHIWLLADPSESRLQNTSIWAMDASYAISPAWTGRANWRYDHVANRATSAGFGLQYRNDCVALDLSVSRRFTSSTSVTPTTDFGVSVDLLGIGGSKRASGALRSCR